MSNGFLFSRLSIPPCGIENGLWLKSIFPSSDSSYIGKSTIQQNLYISFSISSSLLPNSILTSPAIFCAVFISSAMKNMLEFFAIPYSFSSFSFISSVINLPIPPDISPFSSYFVQARPFAPASCIA